MYPGYVSTNYIPHRIFGSCGPNIAIYEKSKPPVEEAYFILLNIDSQSVARTVEDTIRDVEFAGVLNGRKRLTKREEATLRRNN